MQRLISILREVVWSAVLAVAFSGLAILSALTAPDNVALSLSLGLSAVASAVLSQRA